MFLPALLNINCKSNYYISSNIINHIRVTNLYSITQAADQFMNGELRALCYTLAIQRDRRTAVEVQAIAITAELISKHVHTATLQQNTINECHEINSFTM